MDRIILSVEQQLQLNTDTEEKIIYILLTSNYFFVMQFYFNISYLPNRKENPFCTPREIYSLNFVLETLIYLCKLRRNKKDYYKCNPIDFCNIVSELDKVDYFMNVDT